MRALILVDLQNDFLPGGSLAVAEGDAVISVANRLIPSFDLVVATQDWHPHDHLSFASQHTGKQVGDRILLGGVTQALWPDHCVQGTDGAAFAEELDVRGTTDVFHKGTDREIDSYSGFFDNGHRKSTGLGEFIQSRRVTGVYILGLATDYCVKFTALDASKLGIQVHVILDGCRGVELKPGDCQRAIEAMQDVGAVICHSDEV